MLKRKILQWSMGVLAAVMLVSMTPAPLLAAIPLPAKTMATVPVPENPEKKKAKWEKKGNTLFRLDENGKKVTGYFIVDKKKYYARPNGAVVQKVGWFNNAVGRICFARSGGIIRAGVIKHENKMYYVDGNGARRNGHFKGNDGKYYFTVKGRIFPGWNNSGSRKFFADKNGRLYTGTKKIEGKTYVFDNTGLLSSSSMTVTMNGQIVTDSELNIISRIVTAEVGGFNNAEVFKAQAIAARSWVLSQQLRGVVAPSVVGKPATENVLAAVKEVNGLALTYGGVVAFTPYFAFSNGKTNPSNDFWEKSNFPYLKIRSSRYDNQSPGFETTTILSRKKFLEIMDKTYGKNNYVLPENQADWIKPKYNNAGYVKGRLQVGSRQPTVEYFYQTMIGLRSPSFKVTVNPKNNTFIFVTKGWGHGVGMSQRGAYYYNQYKNYNHKQILAHYYPGTVLEAV